MNKLEIAALIDKCSKSKHNIKTIKDETLKVLVETIITTRTVKTIVKELAK